MNLDDRGFYCIQVDGLVRQEWSEYLQGLTITVSQATGSTITTLAGEVQDQAALMGVVNALYQMGHALISVECQSCSDERS